MRKFVLFLVLLLLLLPGGSVFSYTNDSEIQTLARFVSGEAADCDYFVQTAIAAVVLNRVKSTSFPDSIASVIYQPGAFEVADQGRISDRVSVNSSIYNACLDAVNGADPTNGALYFYNTEAVNNRPALSQNVIKSIGRYSFTK